MAKYTTNALPVQPAKGYISKVTLTFLLVLLGGCASTDTWTRRDTLMQSTMYAVMIADAYSTSNIQYDPTQREIGPIARHVLGPQPKTSSTWQYFTALAVVHYFVVRALPEEWRTTYQAGVIGTHTYWVHNNYTEGLFKQWTPPPTPKVILPQPIR